MYFLAFNFIHITMSPEIQYLASDLLLLAEDVYPDFLLTHHILSLQIPEQLCSYQLVWLLQSLRRHTVRFFLPRLKIVVNFSLKHSYHSYASHFTTIANCSQPRLRFVFLIKCTNLRFVSPQFRLLSLAA